MEVKYLDWRNIPDDLKASSAVIGYFDGLHRGHQALINKSQQIAKELKIKNALTTFSPDPNDILLSQKTKHLQKFTERLKVVESLGVDICYVLHFDHELASLDPDLFISDIITKLNLNALVCGFDFHYGFKGKGNALTLKEKAPIRVEVIEAVLYDGEKISSTRIKEALLNGKIELVNQLLAYNYFVSGKVVHGKHIGHELGFPTLNIAYDEEVLLAKEAVYAGYAKIDNSLYLAMINIGHNPTIATGNDLTVEAHILDFDKDIYQKEVKLYLLHYLRDCQRFNSKNDLARQLESDVMEVRKLFNNGYFIL